MNTPCARLFIVPLAGLLLTTLGACTSPPEENNGETTSTSAPSSAEPTNRPTPDVMDSAKTTDALDFELAMKNPGRPLDGVLTGGQPTVADLDTLAANGYRTVINLRAEGEPGLEGEAEHVRSLGMDYVHLPIAGADDLTPKTSLALAEVIGDPDRRPALVHCASSNRVGALLALAAFYDDTYDPDAAVALGKAGGLGSLEAAVRQTMATTPVNE